MEQDCLARRGIMRRYTLTSAVMLCQNVDKPDTVTVARRWI